MQDLSVSEQSTMDLYRTVCEYAERVAPRERAAFVDADLADVLGELEARNTAHARAALAVWGAR